MKLCRNLLIAALCLAGVAAHAATPSTDTICGADTHVLRNGVEQFCANCITPLGDRVDYSGTCGGTQPPPAGLYASGRLTYGGRGGFISNANLLDWAVLWGRQGVEGQPTPFPGASGATPVWTPGRAQYTCSKFRTPDPIPRDNLPPLMPRTTGQVKNSRYYSASVIDVAWSTSCGDFAPAQTKCHAEAVPTNENPVIPFDIGGTGTGRCHMPPSTDMFLNIRRTSPTETGAISVIGQQG